MRGGSQRVWVVGALVAGVAAVVLLSLRFHADQVAVWAASAAVVLAVPTLVPLLRRPEPPGLVTVADVLAIAVADQWSRAAAERRLLSPAPIPVCIASEVLRISTAVVIAAVMLVSVLGALIGVLAHCGILLTGPGFGAGLWPGILAGLALFRPQTTWSLLLADLQLRRAAGTPTRLRRFLDDARQRRVLRTVGPLYQFRHARLQDRLAEPPPVPPGAAADTGPPSGDPAAV